MPQPSDTALKGRARTLLEAMTERARWIYAIPLEAGESQLRPILGEAGLSCEEEDGGARVARFVRDAGDATFVVWSSAELDVTLVEASGSGAPEVLAKLLDRTGFYAQSQLLRSALDVADAECVKALRTLAHMVVAWDEDWTDLFLLHLASPDAVVRHEAVASLSIAAMVAREPDPAVHLLEEASRREKFPKLKETIEEAIQVIRGATGGPISPKDVSEA